MIKPTDPNYEAAQGRIEVWLSLEQIEMLKGVAGAGRESEDHTVAQKWADIFFRLAAAVHKAPKKGNE